MSAAACQILQEVNADMLTSPVEWPRWVLALSGDAVRLSEVAVELRQQLSGPTAHVATARLGHVLMLLSRPHEAAALLAGSTAPICRAQRCLAQVQVIRDDAYNGDLGQKDAERALALRRLLDEMPMWLPVGSALDAEAQMRLHYARLLIYILLEQNSDAEREWQQVSYFSNWLGCDLMRQILDGIAVQFSQQKAPLEVAAAMVAQLSSPDFKAAPLQQLELARDALTLLLPAAPTDLVESLSAVAGPQAVWWPDAVAAMSGQQERLPPLHLAPNDGLMVLAHSYVGAVQAERLSEQHSIGPSKTAASTALRLCKGQVEYWGRQSIFQRLLIGLAYLSAGMMSELRALLREVMQLTSASGIVQIYRSGLVLHLALHLEIRQEDLRKASTELQSALAALPDDQTQRTVLGRLWQLWPTVMYWLAQQSGSEWTGQFAPAYAVYDGSTVKMNGQLLPYTPRGAAMCRALRDALSKEGPFDSAERQALRRFRQGLTAAGSPPMVDTRRVERLSRLFDRWDDEFILTAVAQ